MTAGEEELRCDGIVRPETNRQGRRSALLPTRTVQCHAANLMPLVNGDLACVWFAGTQEGMSDISVHFSRLASGRERWTDAVRLDDDPARSEQNPILFPAPDGRLWLLYTSQKSGNQDTAVVRFRTSSDLGTTWSAPATLIGTQQGTFVRQPLHVRPDGAWLLPVFHCRTRPGERWTGSHDTSAVMISRDAGATWSHHEVPSSLGAVHMNIVPLRTGDLLALYRSRWADHIYRSRSTDGGETWTPPQPTSLPNNNSSIQAIALRDGRIAVVYNASSAADATGRRQNLYDDLEDDEGVTPSPRAAADEPMQRSSFWGAPRAPLCLALSDDAGETWRLALELDTSDGYCMTNNSRDRLNRELSYPSIKETPDGRVHIAYTYFRRTIKHVVLDKV